MDMIYLGYTEYTCSISTGWYLTKLFVSSKGKRIIRREKGMRGNREEEQEQI